jgi:hypothetical protein
MNRFLIQVGEVLPVEQTYRNVPPLGSKYVDTSEEAVLAPEDQLEAEVLSTASMEFDMSSKKIVVLYHLDRCIPVPKSFWVCVDGQVVPFYAPQTWLPWDARRWSSPPRPRVFHRQQTWFHQQLSGAVLAADLSRLKTLDRRWAYRALRSFLLSRDLGLVEHYILAEMDSCVARGLDMSRYGLTVSTRDTVFASLRRAALQEDPAAKDLYGFDTCRDLSPSMFHLAIPVQVIARSLLIEHKAPVEEP